MVSSMWTTERQILVAQFRSRKILGVVTTDYTCVGGLLRNSYVLIHPHLYPGYWLSLEYTVYMLRME
jgi:hypothetical protein